MSLVIFMGYWAIGPSGYRNSFAASAKDPRIFRSSPLRLPLKSLASSAYAYCSFRLNYANNNYQRKAPRPETPSIGSARVFRLLRGFKARMASTHHEYMYVPTEHAPLVRT